MYSSGRVKPDFDDKYYVYALCKPCGTPFYIGKGKGSRINNHFKKSSLSVNTPKNGKIKKYGNSVKREIIGYFSSENAAYECEEWLISHYGLESEGGFLTNYAKTRYQYSDLFFKNVTDKATQQRCVVVDKSIAFKILAFRYTDCRSFSFISNATGVGYSVVYDICKNNRDNYFTEIVESGIIKNNIGKLNHEIAFKRCRSALHEISDESLIKAHKDYIHCKYTLNAIAEHLGTSSKYLSDVFVGRKRKYLNLNNKGKLFHSTRTVKYEDVVSILNLRYVDKLSLIKISKSVGIPRTTVSRVCNFVGQYAQFKGVYNK